MILAALGQPVPGRENCIFDFGENGQRNRISLYINTNQQLCFRVIDKNGKAISAGASAALDTFYYNAVLYCVGSYGITENESFITLAVNGRVIAEHRQPAPIEISKTPAKWTGVMGAGFPPSGGAVMNLQKLALWSRTLTGKEDTDILKFLSDQAKKGGPWVEFGGNSALAAEMENPFAKSENK